jgi:hypothetical protein
MLAVIIASGPSLTQDQVDACQGKARVYAVNNAYKLAPWADVLYACDEEWWDHYKPGFEGEKWTINIDAARKYGLNLIEHDTRLCFSVDKGLIATGGNSGFQALNLAFEQGCRKAILLGFDFHSPMTHFFGEHPGPMRKNPCMHNWVAHMAAAAPVMAEYGYEVINSTPNSAIKSFPFMDIKDALSKLSHA